MSSNTFGKVLAKSFGATLEAEFPQPGCTCLGCEEARVKAANPLMIVNPDGTLEPTTRLSSDQITWFNNLVKMLPERDREIAELKDANEYLVNLVRKIDDDTMRLVALNDEVLRHLAAKDARIAELDTELAAFRGQDIVTTPEAEKPSPFRDFRTDPRRMGPL